MAEAPHNPYEAGQFSSGTMVQGQLVPSFAELGIDRRLAVFVDIAAKPEVSVLAFRYRYVDFSPLDLAPSYRFLWIDSGGIIRIDGNIPIFEDKTINFVESSTQPIVVEMTDENGDPRYVKFTQDDFGFIDIEGTLENFPNVRQDTIQYFGPLIEMIGEDGQTVYHLKALSTNGLVAFPIRVEPQRTMPLRVSMGHPKPYNQDSLWIGSLQKVSDIHSRIEQTETSFGGISIPTVSGITIQLADAFFDYIVNQSWDTRAVEIRAGLPEEPIGGYKVIYRGETESAEWTYDELNISLRDQSVLFDRTVQPDTYAGTGGYEGTAAVQGVTKPKVYGVVEWFEPVLLDSTLNLYQANDGPVHPPPIGIFNVHEGASPHFTPVADTNLLAWNPTEIDVNFAIIHIDYTRGMFRLPAPPEKPITCTLFGGDVSVPRSSTLADIVLSIARERLPEVNIDMDSFDLHRSYSQQAWGIFIKDNISVGDAFRQLAAPQCDLVMIDRLTTLKLKHIRRFPAKAFITESVLAPDTAVKRLPAPRPGSKYRLGYRRSWTQHDEGQILSTAPDFTRAAVLQEYRWNEVSMSGTDHPGLDRFESAKTVDLRTLFLAAHNDYLVEIALRDYSMRDLYHVTVLGYSFQFELADTVLLQLNRFGMNHPRTGVIIEITETSPSNSNDDRTQLVILC